MRTIWKFELAVTDVQKVTMPAGAAVLHVGVQHPTFGPNRTLSMWASVETTNPPVDRLFAVVGTGHPAPEPNEAKFVGTVLDGPFVWHVFEQPS